jgi:hypothetical protein
MAPNAFEINDKRSVSENPWTNEYVLLTLSLWWVQKTLPGTANFDQEVASTMASLARQLR